MIVNSTLVGDTAVYSCNSGYRVDGAAVLTCQVNSSWSNKVPICRRKYSASTEKLKHCFGIYIAACPVLEEIAGGVVSKIDGDFVGSEANCSCSYGYGMVGGPTLTCMSSGESNGSPPEWYSELHV